MSPLEQLREAGYGVRQSHKGRHLRGVLHRLPDVTPLTHPAVLRLLTNAQVRKGRAYTATELTQIAQPHDNRESFTAALTALVSAGLFQRGYTLECPECWFSAWYTPPQLATPQIPCIGCGAAFTPPLDAALAYQPNPLFATALKSGILTEVLALRHYNALDLTQHHAGIIVQKNGRTTDIDLMICAPDTPLRVLECKDHVPDADALTAQLTHLHAIAADLDAQAVFVTLHKNLAFSPPVGVKFVQRDQILA